MHIVLSGVTSLIGNNIANYFAKKGHNITIVGREHNINFANYKIKLKKINWENPEHIFSDIKQIDAFIHCAGINAKESKLNKEKAFKFNSITSGKIARLCRENNVKTFIFLSTIHVYSSNPIGLINEDFLTNNQHPYAQSKLKAEELIKKNFKNSGTKFLILRLSNVIASPLFKETNCWELVAQNICKQIFEKKYIALRSNPGTLRDFIGINVLNKFLEYYFANLSFINSDTYNFASGKSITILELANKIKNNYLKLFNDKIEIKYEEFDVYKFKKEEFCFSIKKIESLGYKIENELNNEINQLLKFSKLNFEI